MALLKPLYPSTAISDIVSFVHTDPMGSHANTVAFARSPPNFPAPHTGDFQAPLFRRPVIQLTRTFYPVSIRRGRFLFLASVGVPLATAVLGREFPIRRNPRANSSRCQSILGYLPMKGHTCCARGQAEGGKGKEGSSRQKDESAIGECEFENEPPKT